MPFCGIPKNASGMIAPEDYQTTEDPIAWTCIREPLGRWFDGVFNDYPTWDRRDPLLKQINRSMEPWAIQEVINMMHKDHLESQWSILSQHYKWEEIEIWPITDFDRARRENGARWSKFVRNNPAGEPWFMSPTRLDHIKDFSGRIHPKDQFIAEWRKVYDRDCRMWHKVNSHYEATNEPLIMTRREFQSRKSWPTAPDTHWDQVEGLWEHLQYQD